MKKVFGCLVSLLIVSQSVFAGNIFVTPGPKAIGMGGAFVAVADDLTALYWNPAGITQLKGGEVELNSCIISSQKTKSNVPLNNAASPNPYDGDFPVNNIYGASGAEPPHYNNKSFDVNAILPFAAGAFKVRDMMLGVGFYAIGGGGGKWDDVISGALNPADIITATAEGTLGVVIVNATLAKQINPKLSLAAGLNMVNVIDKLKFTKQYNASVGSPLKSYGAFVENDGSGYGTELVAGALYKATEKTKLGAVVRTGSTVTIKGKSTFMLTGIDAIGGYPAGTVDKNVSTNYTKTYAYPFTISLGASYAPSKSLTIGAGIEQDFTSSMRNDVKHDTVIAGAFQDENTDAGWKDTVLIHLGADYCVSDKISLRAGYLSDPSPYKSNNLTILDTNQYSFSILTAGFGYKLASGEIGICYAYAISDKPSKNQREYEFSNSNVRIGGSYRF